MNYDEIKSDYLESAMSTITFSDMYMQDNAYEFTIIAGLNSDIFIDIKFDEMLDLFNCKRCLVPALMTSDLDDQRECEIFITGINNSILVLVFTIGDDIFKIPIIANKSYYEIFKNAIINVFNEIVKQNILKEDMKYVSKNNHNQ